jgi:hypothetical protein
LAPRNGQTKLLVRPTGIEHFRCPYSGSLPAGSTSFRQRFTLHLFRTEGVCLDGHTKRWPTCCGDVKSMTARQFIEFLDARAQKE